MSSNIDQLNELLSKLNQLTRRQDIFAKEIADLREEIKKFSVDSVTSETEKMPPTLSDIETQHEEIECPVLTQEPTYRSATASNSQATNKQSKKAPILLKNNMEELIGENLISKIGIIILILGVGIGAKYAIDHQLISPTARITLGYIVGFVLLGFSIKLKKNYDNFSAVLISGAMAIMYFITFAAYNFFALLPQSITFGLMALFTIFTVEAALNYNKQVIAHIGLVGAYAVPFLLSDGSGNIAVLFSYMAIINIGILAIAFFKNWKSLNYVAFGLTWLIFASWYMTGYNADIHFSVALIFLFIFFISFYATFLTYKLIQKQIFEITDIVLILSNSFYFYGLGYALLDNSPIGSQMLGLFTVANAALHAIISLIVFKQKLADRNLFFLVSGLVLVFIAIAIPVQLDGNWVTLLWVGEATVLFWIGRTKKVVVYEVLAYILMGLSVISHMQDWTALNDITGGSVLSTLYPVLNVQFLSSILFIAALWFIYQLNRKYASVVILEAGLQKNISNAMLGLLVFFVYATFFREIAFWFNQLYLGTATRDDIANKIIYNRDIISFKTGWLIDYSLFFMSFMTFINVRKLKSKPAASINLVASLISILVFLTAGLMILSNLRGSYLRPAQPCFYPATVYYLIFRYFMYVFVAITFLSSQLYITSNFVSQQVRNVFVIFTYSTVLWILTSELINWMDIAGYSESYKLGVTILWGVYSLSMIVIGIWKQNKNIRITAIVIFALTLAKLFLYDITDLNTISKTIVLVSLGILLLIISFLYNKYKHYIFDENE